MNNLEEILLATRNPSKIEQIRPIFNGFPCRILTMDDVGIKGEAVEDGTTLEENALKKALFAYQGASSSMWTLADDTGLSVEALGGRPGIHAARWAGDVSTEEITAHTLRMLQGAKTRRAIFRTVVAVVSWRCTHPDEESWTFVGEVHGVILETPRCKPQPKMPYSAIFLPDGSDKVWAEMTTEEENAISHRGVAFRKAREFIEEYNSQAI